MGGMMERSIVDEARAGCPRAFTEVIRSMEPRMRRWALDWTDGDPDEADDVVQDTLLAVHQRLHTLRSAGALESWLWTLVRNASIQRKRYAANRPWRSRAGRRTSGLPSPDPSPLDQVVAGDVENRLKRALERLPGAQRRAVTLVGFRGLTAREAGDDMGISPVTVRVNLSRGRAALRAVLEERRCFDARRAS